MINNLTLYLKGWKSRIFPWCLEKISKSSYLDWNTPSSAGSCWIRFQARCLTKRWPWQGTSHKPILYLTMFIYFCVDNCIYVRSKTLEVVFFIINFCKSFLMSCSGWNTSVILSVMYYSRFLCKVLFWILYFMLLKATSNICLVIKK
jgi:hypothetical protein